MKARIKLILSSLFAFVIAAMVLFAVCSQSGARYAAADLNVRIEQQTDAPAPSDMSSAAHKRVTMLRGFAYALGRRCRVWRRSVRSVKS